MSDIRGQREAKRVLEIAAAGGHNLLIKGSPGCGKTMLAERICGILPPMTFSEAREVTSVYSAAGLLNRQGGLITDRPFRIVHPGISPAGLTGGGSRLRPGEITLAHNGVLFLDEFAEFCRQTSETLRGPIEDKKIILNRNGRNYVFPANFMLIGAANPCKCGYLYEEGRCKCTPSQIRNYCRGISGPLADRIDIHIEMVTVRYSDTKKEEAETSRTIRERVIRVREIQKERYKDENIKTNGALYGNLVEKYCVTDTAARSLLELIMEKQRFSLRSYGKILKISRTIADMKEKEIIGEEEIAEAVRYRPVTGGGADL